MNQNETVNALNNLMGEDNIGFQPSDVSIVFPEQDNVREVKSLTGAIFQRLSKFKPNTLEYWVCIGNTSCMYIMCNIGSEQIGENKDIIKELYDNMHRCRKVQLFRADRFDDNGFVGVTKEISSNEMRLVYDLRRRFGYEK